MTSQKLFAAFVSGCLFTPAIQLLFDSGSIKILTLYLFAALAVGYYAVVSE